MPLWVGGCKFAKLLTLIRNTITVNATRIGRRGRLSTPLVRLRVAHFPVSYCKYRHVTTWLRSSAVKFYWIFDRPFWTICSLSILFCTPLAAKITSKIFVLATWNYASRILFVSFIVRNEYGWLASNAKQSTRPKKCHTGPCYWQSVSLLCQFSFKGAIAV